MTDFDPERAAVWMRQAIIDSAPALLEENKRLRAEVASMKSELKEISIALNDPADNLIRTTAECVSELRKDAKRLDWLQRHFFERKWDGTIGRKCDWYLVGNYRHAAQRMRGDTFREAIDAALGGESRNG